jgi:hypothetical protein
MTALRPQLQTQLQTQGVQLYRCLVGLEESATEIGSHIAHYHLKPSIPFLKRCMESGISRIAVIEIHVL